MVKLICGNIVLKPRLIQRQLLLMRSCVFVITTNGQAFALNVATGRIRVATAIYFS